MSNPIAPNVIYEFLGGARVFAKAVRDVIESAVLEEVTGAKLSMPQLKLLYLVAHVDSVTIGEVASFLGVSSSAASKTVEKLVRRRFLRRSDIQGDRRSSHLSVTESCRRWLQIYEEARNKKAAEIFSQYSPDVLCHIAELLDHLACGIASRRADSAQNATCMQCEMYYRDYCRFGQLGGRKCFYQLHRKNQPEPPAAKAADSEQEKEA